LIPTENPFFLTFEGKTAGRDAASLFLDATIMLKQERAGNRRKRPKKKGFMSREGLLKRELN
jgi:hypothetical protein